LHRTLDRFRKVSHQMCRTVKSSQSLIRIHLLNLHNKNNPMVRRSCRASPSLSAKAVRLFNCHQNRLPESHSYRNYRKGWLKDDGVATTSKGLWQVNGSFGTDEDCGLRTKEVKSPSLANYWLNWTNQNIKTVKPLFCFSNWLKLCSQ
jgi:hypothetical protein